MSRNDEIDFVSLATFRRRLPKLFRLVIEESIVHGINLDDFDFISCQNDFDLIDVSFTNHEQDFDVSVKGGERRGYRVLNSELTEVLDENKGEIWWHDKDGDYHAGT